MRLTRHKRKNKTQFRVREKKRRSPYAPYVSRELRKHRPSYTPPERRGKKNNIRRVVSPLLANDVRATTRRRVPGKHVGREHCFRRARVSRRSARPCTNVIKIASRFRRSNAMASVQCRTSDRWKFRHFLRVTTRPAYGGTNHRAFCRSSGTLRRRPTHVRFETGE